jgi:hypothetical protein
MTKKKKRKVRERGLSVGEIEFCEALQTGELPWSVVQPLADTVTGWTDEEKTPIDELQGELEWLRNAVDDLESSIDDLKQHYASGPYPPPPAPEDVDEWAEEDEDDQ